MYFTFINESIWLVIAHEYKFFSVSARMNSDPRFPARRSSSTWTVDYVQFTPRVVELEIALFGCAGEGFVWVEIVMSFSPHWGPLIHRHKCLFLLYDIFSTYKFVCIIWYGYSSHVRTIYVCLFNSILAIAFSFPVFSPFRISITTFAGPELLTASYILYFISKD